MDINPVASLARVELITTLVFGLACVPGDTIGWLELEKKQVWGLVDLADEKSLVMSLEKWEGCGIETFHYTI